MWLVTWFTTKIFKKKNETVMLPIGSRMLWLDIFKILQSEVEGGYTGFKVLSLFHLSVNSLVQCKTFAYVPLQSLIFCIYGICIKIKWNVTYKNEVTVILTFKCQGHIGIFLIISGMLSRAKLFFVVCTCTSLMIFD